MTIRSSKLSNAFPQNDVQDVLGRELNKAMSCVPTKQLADKAKEEVIAVAG